MANQNVEVELFIAGAWEEQVKSQAGAALNADVLSADGITIYKGGDDESGFRPHRIELTFNDSAGRYRTSNPLSPLYGIAGRNTGCRVKVAGVTTTTCEASSWRPSRTVDFNPVTGKGRAWVKLVAEGVTRRLGQWTEPLRSPLYRRISRYANLVGYWPMEDDTFATQLANTVTTGIPGAALPPVTYRGGNGPPGSEPVLKLGSGAVLGSNFISASTTAGWQICFSMKLDVMPSSGTYLPMLWWTTSNGYTHVWELSNGAYQVRVYDRDGVALYTSGAILHTTIPTQWTIFNLKSSGSAGTVTIDWKWYQALSPGAYGVATTYAGTLGRLNRWGISGNAWTTNALVGHVFGVTTIADDLLSVPSVSSFNGYLGEMSGTRFIRLTGEEGITRFTVGTSGSDGFLMGVQLAATFMDLLQECTQTDDGRFDDERYALGAVTQRTRRSMYNQTPALALTYPTHIAYPFEEQVDDKATGNRVTAKNVTGSEFTATSSVGSMSTQLPPNGVGEVKKTVDVSVYQDSDLEIIAGWHLSKGTLDRPRYESVTVDLVANPSLATACNAIREGDLITITGYEPDPIPLLVIGIVQQVGHSTRTFTFTTRPADLYRTGIYDNTATLYDSRSTLNAGVTSTATTMVFTFTDIDEAWSVAGFFPYDVMIAGERIRVTAMGAITGSGPWTQSATVTRSMNGIIKPQVTGAAVRVSTTVVARYAL